MLCFSLNLGKCKSDFFRDRTGAPGCRRAPPLAPPTNLSCAPQPLVAGSRRWRHRVRLDEAVISSRGGVRFFCLPEPLSPSGHLRARVPPPLFWRCQSLTGGARTAGDQCCPGVVFQPGHLQGGLQGAPPARIFTRKMGLLSAAQNFLPLRGANKVAPLRRRKLFEGGGRAK